MPDRALDGPPAPARRWAADRLFRHGESLWLVDTVEWGVLEGPEPALKDWHDRNRPRFMYVETAFKAAIETACRAWILAGTPAGLRPEPDHELLAAWMAANVAEEVRAGRLAPYAREVVAQQKQAVGLLEAVGMKVRGSAWAAGT